MRGPDFQKREAKRSLWNLDGQHSSGKSANRGRPRGQDKELIRQQLLEDMSWSPEDEAYSAELEAAWNCELNGGCPTCGYDDRYDLIQED